MARLMIQTPRAAERMRALCFDKACHAALVEQLGRPLNAYDGINLYSLGDALMRAARRTVWPCTIGGLTTGLHELAEGILEYANATEFPAEGESVAVENSVYANATLKLDPSDVRAPKKSLEDILGAGVKAGTVYGWRVEDEDPTPTTATMPTLAPDEGAADSEETLTEDEERLRAAVFDENPEDDSLPPMHIA